VDRRKAFGLAVREARIRKQWSQDKLAEAAGVDRSYVWGLEKGTRNPALLTQGFIADALGVPLQDLVSEAERIRQEGLT
jgi:transcriptional regulator with XRE-family HTH domain